MMAASAEVPVREMVAIAAAARDKVDLVGFLVCIAVLWVGDRERWLRFQSVACKCPARRDRVLRRYTFFTRARGRGNCGRTGFGYARNLWKFRGDQERIRHSLNEPGQLDSNAAKPPPVIVILQLLLNRGRCRETAHLIQKVRPRLVGSQVFHLGAEAARELDPPVVARHSMDGEKAKAQVRGCYEYREFNLRYS